MTYTEPDDSDWDVYAEYKRIRIYLFTYSHVSEQIPQFILHVHIQLRGSMKPIYKSRNHIFRGKTNQHCIALFSFNIISSSLHFFREFQSLSVLIPLSSATDPFLFRVSRVHPRNMKHTVGGLTLNETPVPYRVP